MEDPCVRKATSPLPVMAPQKRSATEEDKIIKEKKMKTILEEDLDMSDSEIIKETEQSVNNLLNSMVEEMVKENNEDSKEDMKKQSLTEETLKDNDGDSMIQETVKENSEVNKEDMKKQSLSEESLKDNVGDSMIEETVEETSEVNKEGMKKQSLTEEQLKDNVGASKKEMEKKGVKKIISKEIVLSSDEDSNFETVKERIKKNMGLKKKTPTTVLIPPKQKNRCKHFFVKKPKRGERCTNLTTGDYCSAHNKEDRKIEKPNKPNKVEETMRDIMTNAQEMNSKVEHLMSKVQQTSFDELKKKVQELESQLQNLKSNKTKQHEAKINANPKKLHKLNKKLTYKLIGIDEMKNVKLESENQTYLVKLPKTFTPPKEIEKTELKFNFEKNVFEFIKL